MDIRTASMDHLKDVTLGTSKVVRELGRGSMGVVFRGIQKTLNRPVAIKVLPKSFIRDPTMAARFKEEAESAANLSHPNIISIYEWGKTTEVFFIVMQLVRGESLAHLLERVRKYPIPSRRLVPLAASFTILLQVLDGLGYAHDEGIFHRDIKPANILLETKDRSERISIAALRSRDAGVRRSLISDFGIARDPRGDDLDHGKILGTPLYMAPEQAAGRELDGRADLYAVGVILFEMAAGDLPIYSEPIAKLRQRKITEPMGLFNKRPREAHPRIGAHLEEIILRAIAFDPEKRYPSAQSFAEDLEDYRDRLLRGRKPAVGRR